MNNDHLNDRPLIVAVDFDGTIVENMFPEIGPEVPGAFKWLNIFKEAGAKLLLWTVRSDTNSYMRHDNVCGKVLSAAVSYCGVKGIGFDGVNEYYPQKAWSDSEKVFAHVYIDDAAFGCPLINGVYRPVVDWSKVGPEVYKRIIGELN